MRRNLKNSTKKLLTSNKLSLIATRGLPASGKSTWARKKCDDNLGKYKLVDKDSLRSCIDNGQWSKHNEEFVLKTRNFIIEEALKDGYSVIVHDTNLYNKHMETFKEIARKYSAEFIVQDFTDVPLEECIKRDLKRLNSVGKDVIVKMYKDFLEPAAEIYRKFPELPNCLWVDLDGTLAHMDNGKPGYRRPYEWKRVGEDIVDESIADLVRSYKRANPDVKIVIMSGRSDECKYESEKWLKDNNIPYDEIHMRKFGDNRSDAIVKEELFYKWINGRYNVLFCLDDRQKVVDMARNKLGLKVLQVQPGDF